MQPKEENKPADVSLVTHQPLPPEYEPYSPTEKQKRSLERLIKKKRPSKP